MTASESARTYTVATVEVEVGDVVQEGDVIATLDTTDLQKQIDSAEQSYSDDLQSAQTTYDRAVESYEVAVVQHDNRLIDLQENIDDADKALADAQQALEDAKVRPRQRPEHRQQRPKHRRFAAVGLQCGAGGWRPMSSATTPRRTR